MIAFEHFILDNGLKVYVHEDHTTPLAVLNILYNVGARDEDESRTGFAHLFEHLMFGGSQNVPSFDEALQNAGGENNAFTSNDITNYYITIPSSNIETAFWLESDRMLSLSFDPNVLEVQRKVVIEEFKQRYLNQPYGDIWLNLRPLAYRNHPYKWATIGKDISHIEKATMEDVKDFFFKFYRPNNAVMVVGGNVTVEQVRQLSEKWFGSIPKGPEYKRNLPQEPEQKEARFLTIEEKVPLDAIYKTFHMPARYSEDYHTADLLGDILGRGKSSRLYNRLVKEEKLFNTIGCFSTGSLDPGLLVVQGKLNSGVDIELADKKIWEILEEIKKEEVSELELTKVKNQAESSLIFGEVELLNRAMNLAAAAVVGNPDLVNEEAEQIQAVTIQGIQGMANKLFRESNCSTVFYKSKKN
ncbi:MAG TPA: pitrilysin family protein [Cytophagales bacterium]|nr:pitrilysin family protein [Cytophagales bacterium]